MAVAPVVAAGISKATVATAATVVGTALSAIGAIRQGSLQSSALAQQAERERQQSEIREEDFRRKQARLEGTRRARLGAAGVEPGAGSPLLASEEFAGESELQALRIRSGGEAVATRLEQQAQLTRSKGRTRAGSLLLSGTSRAFG